MLGRLFGIRLNRSCSPGQRLKSVLKLGDRVRVADGDQGIIRGFHPDGKIIVYLVGEEKSKAIFPTFLREMDR